MCDLDVIIDTGAADITVWLPREHSARVKDEAGLYTIEATALTQHENVYTKAAYGVSEVTVQVDMESSIVQRSWKWKRQPRRVINRWL